MSLWQYNIFIVYKIKCRVFDWHIFICVTLCFLLLTVWVLRHNKFAFFFSFYELCSVSNSHKYFQYLTYSCLSPVMVLLYPDLVWNGKVPHIITCKHTNLVLFWGLQSSGMLQCHYVDVSVLIIVKLFHTCPDWPWGPPILLYVGYQVSFQGLKRLVCGVHRTSPCSAEVKERLELYLSGPLWSVTGWSSPFNLAHYPKKTEDLSYTTVKAETLLYLLSLSHVFCILNSSWIKV